MNGYGSHTFKLVNAKGEPVYCKFHYKTDQGIKNLDAKRAGELEGVDPDYSIRDLYNAIAKGNYPSWTMYIQVMTFEQAEKWKLNPFDLTKVWPHGEFPLIKVGKLVLDRNPQNYFAEVEQMAYDPSNMPPGILPSPDKMLQGRLFSYPDTHRHRLGANYLQLPVNCPYKVNVKNYQRDGPMCFTDNQAGAPNYYPNSFGGPDVCPRARTLDPKYKIVGDAQRIESGESEDNFVQATEFWNKTLDVEARKRLVNNIAGHLINASPFLQERAVKMFGQVSSDFGKMLQDALNLKRSANL